MRLEPPAPTQVSVYSPRSRSIRQRLRPFFARFVPSRVSPPSVSPSSPSRTCQSTQPVPSTTIIRPAWPIRRFRRLEGAGKPNNNNITRTAIRWAKLVHPFAHFCLWDRFTFVASSCALPSLRIDVVPQPRSSDTLPWLHPIVAKQMRQPHPGYLKYERAPTSFRRASPKARPLLRPCDEEQFLRPATHTHAPPP